MYDPKSWSSPRADRTRLRGHKRDSVWYRRRIHPRSKEEYVLTFHSLKLESLTLFDLPNLERFRRGHYIDCPFLSLLEIRGCPKLRAFVKSTTSKSTTEDQNENPTGPMDKQHLHDHKVFFFLFCFSNCLFAFLWKPTKLIFKNNILTF